MSETPGVAQWAFRSLFNRETPMSKYQQMKLRDQQQQQQQQQQRTFDTLDDTLDDDTFHYRRPTRRAAKSQDDRFIHEDPLVRKKVSWNSLRRSNSVGAIDEDNYTLPHGYPGKFPRGGDRTSVTALDDDILTSSATRSHLRDATANMQRNIPSFTPTKPSLRSSRSMSSRPALKHSIDKQQILEHVESNNNELLYLLDNIKDDDVRPRLKYEALKMELSKELQKSQRLYDAYFRDVNKHNLLKKQYKLLKSEVEDNKLVKQLQDKLESTSLENLSLKQQLNNLEFKLQEDDFRLSDLKQSLQSTSKFEVTLRRKIQYLEDKLESERSLARSKQFELEEKVYLLEMKCKDYEEGSLPASTTTTKNNPNYKSKSTSGYHIELDSNDTIDKLMKETGI